MVAQPCRCHAPPYVSELTQRPLTGLRARSQPARRFENLFTTNQRRDRQESLGMGTAHSGGGEDGFHLADVLASSRLPDGPASGFGKSHATQKTLKKSAVANRNSEPRDSQTPQGLSRQNDRLRVGGRPSGPDQLDSDL